MAGIFWGFLIVFIDINVSLGGQQIIRLAGMNLTQQASMIQLDLLPDFVGYFLIMRAYRSLQPYSAKFGQGAKLALLAAALDLLSLGLELARIRIPADNVLGLFLVTAIFMTLSFAVSYYLLQGLADMERSGLACSSAKLQRAWQIQVLASVAAVTCAFVVLAWLALLALLTAFIANIVFLIYLWQIKKCLESTGA